MSSHIKPFLKPELMMILQDTLFHPTAFPWKLQSGNILKIKTKFLSESHFRELVKAVWLIGGRGDIPKIRQMFSAEKKWGGVFPKFCQIFRHKKGNLVPKNTIFSLFSLFLAFYSAFLAFFGQPYLMQKLPLAEKSAKHLPQ